MFGASFTTYYLALKDSALSPEIARSMGLVIIMIGNLFLVQVNSSDSEFAYKTFGKLIKDKVMIAIIVGTILGVGIILYSPLNIYLKLAPLSLIQLLLVITIAFAAVFWYEIVKLINKIRKD
jgi:Ca2+-transporting ATPase